MPDQSPSTETLPFRTEPTVVDPSVYLEHQLEAPFYFPSQQPESTEEPEELIERLKQQKKEQDDRLTADQLLEAIYHPDERVLLSVIDDTRERVRRTLPKLDLQDPPTRVRDMVRLLFSGHGNGETEHPDLSWDRIQSNYHEKLAAQVRERAWKRGLQTAQTEEMLWNPILDHTPRKFRNSRHQRNLRPQINERIHKLGEWAETAQPEQLEAVMEFRHPALIEHLITERLHCFPAQRAGTVVRRLHENDQSIQSSFATDDQLTTEHLLAMSRALLDSEKPVKSEQLRILAGHPQAHSQVWDTILQAYQQHITEEQETVIDGRYHLCKRWMRHKSARRQYLEMATEPEFARALHELELPLDDVGDIALRNHPRWVAHFLLWENEPPCSIESGPIERKLYPRINAWLQAQPRSRLVPLLQIEDGQIRQEILLRLSERKTEPPDRVQTEGPGRNQPRPRTTPFQPREMS